MHRQPNVYDELSRRLYGFNRDLIKRELLLHCYRGPQLDPWLTHMIQTELRALKLEYLDGDGDLSSAASTRS